MKIPDFANIAKRVVEFIPKQNIERLVFKILSGAWIFVILGVIVLQSVFTTRDDIERRIIGAATEGESSVAKTSEIAKYESSLNLAKYPEGIEQYTQQIKRDPFSEHRKEFAIQPLTSAERDFVLESIGRIELPMVYRGYIELPDVIIGQVNWHDSTRFVKAGSLLNGYKILNISKEKLEALDRNGQKVKFELNKLVYGDELQAILYDNISEESFDVRIASVIDDYKVIDIAPNYVILLTKDKKIKLEK